jgi:DNA-binding transcriptional LysR family regulator
MEMRHLRYFIAVAEEGHITRAAERLNMQQPPLSQQIHALEKELGVQLFRRKPRGVELTDGGRAFLDEARVILARVDHAVATTRRTARGEQGRVAIGFTSSAPFHPFVPRAIRSFRDLYPLVALQLEEAGTSELVDALRDEQVDAAFIRSPVSDPLGLVVLPLLEEDMLVALPSGHALAPIGAIEQRPAVRHPTAEHTTALSTVGLATKSGDTVQPVTSQSSANNSPAVPSDSLDPHGDDTKPLHTLAASNDDAALPLATLAGETFILYRRLLGPGLYDTIMAACHGAGFSPHVGQEAPRILSTLNLVAAGLGVSIVPASLRRLRMDGVSYRRLEASPRLKAPINLAYRGDEQSAAVRGFVELVRRAAESARLRDSYNDL